MEEVRTRVAPETIISCVDCAGRAHQLTTWPDGDPPHPGEVMTYDWEDCWERLGLVLPDVDEKSDYYEQSSGLAQNPTNGR
jgi:hypothetical protein